MRRFLPVCLVALALIALAAPAGAQTTIIDRPPMDLGADQIGTIRTVGDDLLYPDDGVRTWFDVGGTYPVGNLKDRNIDPGLLVRFNQSFWNDGSLSMFGSVGALFGNDSYFNDAQNAIAAAAPPSPDPLAPYTGIDIQSRYFWMIPATINLAVALPIAESVSPFFAFGPGVVWTHESVVTSAVNNGVGSTGEDPEVLIIGPGGEQGISPYAIRSESKFNLGWDARAGIGFKTGGNRTNWIRAVVSGSTYYSHTVPSTNLGFALSFGR
jgi:hypothetical protein